MARKPTGDDRKQVRPGTRSTKPEEMTRAIPSMKFKGVTVTEDDYKDTLKPHFEPRNTADWRNNEEFVELVQEHQLDPGEVAAMFTEEGTPKSTWTILAWLKPRSSKSSANVTDENLTIFKAALAKRHGKHQRAAR
jgi:hypothetical protein